MDGGGPEQLRYSSLTQVNRSNVTQLQFAWTRDSGGSGGLQTRPLMVEDEVFVYTSTHKTAALDGATDKSV